MKIGIFIKDFAVGKKFDKTGLPIKSGAEFYGESQAENLINKGHHVYIMAKKRYWWTKARELINGIDLVRLHNPFRWLEIILRLHTTHRNTDAFYIIGRPNFAVWCILYANYYKIPTTMALTGSAEIFQGNKGWRNKIFCKCDNYIALSEDIKEGLKNEGKIAASRIHVLHQGINTKCFCPVTITTKNLLRKSLDFPLDKKIVLFCARVMPVKGIDILQAAWKKIHRKYQDAVLVIVGGGPKKNIEEFYKLGNETDNSIIICGEVDNLEVYYQSADMYVLPSRNEGLPTTLMQALACGLPAIVSDIGGCRDLVKNNFNGYLVPLNNVEYFTEKILKLLKEEKKCLNLARNAVSFAQANYDYSNVVDELECIIKGDETNAELVKKQ